MNKSKLIFIGLGTVLLAIGAFFGTRLFFSSNLVNSTVSSSIQGLAASSGTEMTVEEFEEQTGMTMEEMEAVSESGVGFSDTTQIMLDVDNAKEIPEEEPAAFGIVIGRENDTFTVATGEPEVSFEMDDEGVPNIKFGPGDGPLFEVVVTSDTKLYEDITDFTGQAVSSGSLEQKVKALNSLDDLPSEATLQAWGEVTGDRVIAHTILVMIPDVEIITVNE